MGAVEVTLGTQYAQQSIEHEIKLKPHQGTSGLGLTPLKSSIGEEMATASTLTNNTSSIRRKNRLSQQERGICTRARETHANGNDQGNPSLFL